MTDVTGTTVRAEVSLDELGLDEREWLDRLDDRIHAPADGELAIELEAYSVSWLQPMSEIGGADA